MESWMITDPMQTVAKFILANITSSLEELELKWFDLTRFLESMQSIRMCTECVCTY